MKIIKKENGNLLIPQIIKDDNYIGDKMVEIDRLHLEYEEYLQEYERQEAEEIKNFNEE